MDCIVKYGLENDMVKIAEVPVPKIGENDVLVKVKAAGICGSDIEMWHGMHGHFVNFPVIMGHEFCGIIESVGKNVNDFKAGDRVVCETAAYVCGNCQFCRSGNYHLCPDRLGFGYGTDGGFADYVKVRKEILHYLPENISFEEGSITEPLCVAYNAVGVNSKILAGDVVVIIGPGPIGLNCLQIAKISGVGTVIISGTNGDKNRLDLAGKLGADICVNVNKQDLLKIVMDETKNIGADLVIITGGNASTLYQSIEFVKKSGQITKLGWDPDPYGFSLDLLISKAITLKGSFSHNWVVWEKVLRLLKKGKLVAKPLITHILDISDWKKGFELMESKIAVKVVLKP
ncbi:MAG: zinc-binding dehydrogenase [Actinobacteria bacterium]|nr:zinc-binding dehydrogenase [Actinomycetota bacterium]